MRVFLRQFGAESLEFEVIYFALTTNINEAKEVRHRINVELYRRFESEGIPLAHRSPVLHLMHAIEPVGVANEPAPPQLHS